MAATADMGVNDDHVPSGVEESVLNAFKHERSTYDSSRMTPKLIQRRFSQEVMLGGDAQTSPEEGITKQSVNYALKQLTAAGWVQKIEDGLYEFVTDPRDGIGKPEQANVMVAYRVSDVDAVDPGVERVQAAVSVEEAEKAVQEQVADEYEMLPSAVEIADSEVCEGYPGDDDLDEFWSEVFANDPREVDDDD